MPKAFVIRRGEPGDLPAIESLYRAVFPDEDLVPLVRVLCLDCAAAITYVAVRDGAIAGHAAFTRCGVENSPHPVVLLGPLAVAADARKQGLARALVSMGLDAMTCDGCIRALVLGDPDFYGRLGFTAEIDVRPPYALVREWQAAWQSLPLGAAHAPCRGTLAVPEPWLDRVLWMP